jgi:hypothetical protein
MAGERFGGTARALAAVLFAAGSAACLGGTRNAHVAPPVDVEMDVEVLARFQHEIEEYVELHQELLRRIPTVTPQSTAEEIEAHHLKMRNAIREERRKERPGDILKPQVAAAFRRIIEKELTGTDGRAVLEALRQGNPSVEGVPTATAPNAAIRKRVTVAVNAAYPEDAPVSSVPPHLLLKLPQLPEQVKYRFVGRDLILSDAEANVILDYLKDVLPPSAAR